MVGEPGFEPGASCSQSRRATGLRHSPILLFYTILLFTVLPSLLSRRRYTAELRHSLDTQQSNTPLPKALRHQPLDRLKRLPHDIGTLVLNKGYSSCLYAPLLMSTISYGTLVAWPLMTF